MVLSQFRAQGSTVSGVFGDLKAKITVTAEKSEDNWGKGEIVHGKGGTGDP